MPHNQELTKLIEQHRTANNLERQTITGRILAILISHENSPQEKYELVNQVTDADSTLATFDFSSLYSLSNVIWSLSFNLSTRQQEIQKKAFTKVMSFLSKKIPNNGLDAVCIALMYLIIMKRYNEYSPLYKNAMKLINEAVSSKLALLSNALNKIYSALSPNERAYFISMLNEIYFNRNPAIDKVFSEFCRINNDKNKISILKFIRKNHTSISTEQFQDALSSITIWGRDTNDKETIESCSYLLLYLTQIHLDCKDIEKNRIISTVADKILAYLMGNKNLATALQQYLEDDSNESDFVTASRYLNTFRYFKFDWKVEEGKIRGRNLITISKSEKILIGAIIDGLSFYLPKLILIFKPDESMFIYQLDCLLEVIDKDNQKHLFNIECDSHFHDKETKQIRDEMRDHVLLTQAGIHVIRIVGHQNPKDVVPFIAYKILQVTENYQDLSYADFCNAHSSATKQAPAWTPITQAERPMVRIASGDHNRLTY